MIPLRNAPLNVYAKNFVEWLELSQDAEDHLNIGLSSVSLPSNASINEWKDVINIFGTQLIGKRGRYIVAILSLCTEPINMKSLMNYIGYKNDKTFRDNYILPLRKLQFITLTKPDLPNASDNKYTITEAGKAFLASVD